MKKLIIASAVITALFAAPALAADMVGKAPPPVAAASYSWTGWYAGVNTGASFGNAKTDFSVPVTEFATVGLVTNTFTTSFAGSNTEYPSGFIGGGQIGYNWQYSPLIVVGLEADIEGATEKDSNKLTDNFSGALTGGAAAASGSAVLNYQTKIDWFGTVRGRIGYVWGDGAVMSYLTGGLAYGKVEIAGTSTVTGTVGVTSFGSITSAFGHSHVNTGWTVGYGTEGRLQSMPGWTWKVEGLYIDLGTLDAMGPGGTSSVAIGPGVTIGATVGQVSTHTHFTDGILRGGLNYHF